MSDDLANNLPKPHIRKPWDKNKPRLTEAQRRHLVERRISEAMEEGKFDNLPGAGQPLNIEMPTPGHEELWWSLRLLKQANVVTDEVRYRQKIDDLLARLDTASTEAEVRASVRELNEWIVKLNTMGTNRIPTTLAPLDEEAAVARHVRNSLPE
jgi:hypothetical protein